MDELLHKAAVYDVPIREKDDGFNVTVSRLQYMKIQDLTYFIPLMVRDVAAMLVATTHFLIPGGGG